MSDTNEFEELPFDDEDMELADGAFREADRLSKALDLCEQKAAFRSDALNAAMAENALLHKKVQALLKETQDLRAEIAIAWEDNFDEVNTENKQLRAKLDTAQSEAEQLRRENQELRRLPGFHAARN